MTQPNPPLPGMTVIPKFYGSDMWQLVGGSAWLGLMEWAMTRREFIERFESETGLSLKYITARSSLDAMIDKASGRDAKTMAAWCDWVTINYWGVEAAT